MINILFNNYLYYAFIKNVIFAILFNL